jgi:hypothetical protein
MCQWPSFAAAQLVKDGTEFGAHVTVYLKFGLVLFLRCVGLSPCRSSIQLQKKENPLGDKNLSLCLPLVDLLSL